MSKEFNLSEKIVDVPYFIKDHDMIKKEDVKEFIRRLKEDLGFGIREDTDILLFSEVINKIDKLAGDNLK